MEATQKDYGSEYYNELKKILDESKDGGVVYIDKNHTP